MKVIAKLLFILFFIQVHGQISEPPELIFTTKVRESSELNRRSKENGFDLVKIESECLYPEGTENHHRLIERIIWKKTKLDTLVIAVNTITDCCRKFIGEIDVQPEDTINLIYTTDGYLCECYCYYEVKYFIALENQWDDPQKYQIKLNGKPIVETSEKYVTFPEEYLVENGDTINFVDKYGMRQGYWIKRDSLNRIVLEGSFQNHKDDYYASPLQGFTGRCNIQYHDDSNRISLEEFRVNGYKVIISRVYDQEGNLKKECRYFPEKDIPKCKEWD